MHRLTETTDAGGERINSYAQQSGVERLAIVPPKETRADLGAGDRSRGLLQGFARSAANIAEEDILNVTKGPEAPVKLRVLTLAHPRGRHTEFTCERFTGALS